MKYSELPGAEVALHFAALKSKWPGELDDEYNKTVIRNNKYNHETKGWDNIGPHFVTFVDCSDTFSWGCADAEEVTEDNIHILEETMEELSPYYDKFIEEWDSSKVDMKETAKWQKVDVALSDLFCARVRKLRPQGACYKRYPEELWPLFNAAGPERETGYGNPYAPGGNIKKEENG